MNRVLQPVRWLTAICVLLVLVLLAWQCIDIYRLGNAPENRDEKGVYVQSVYRMEDVADRLSHLSWGLGGCVGVIALSGILHIACKNEKSGETEPSVENRLRLMRKRVPEFPAAAAAEEKKRRVLTLGCGVAVIAMSIPALGYLLTRANFTDQELEAVMGRMLLHVAPWVVLSFAAVIGVSQACRASMERELAALKDAPKGKTEPDEPRRLPVQPIRIALYLLAVLFIVLGVMNGGWYDVLVKAINICTECIGLG